MNRDIYIPAGGPPQGQPPSPDLYKLMGEEGFEALLWSFYLKLSRSKIANLFPTDNKDLQFAAHKSACFFIGLCGGPPLYHQTFGPPRLRARHLPFVIGESARQEWLACFMAALDELTESGQFPGEHRNSFDAFIVGFSTWMVNHKD